MDTIFALSSGAPPAAIAVIRISGPAARGALETLAGKVPLPRRLELARLRDSSGGLLDRALVSFFPASGSVTGEDLAELHLHGGRAVIAAVEGALAAITGLRRAEPGEFTRRALANGKIDLAEAEGLADLLMAETEIQRRVALGQAGGLLSRKVEAWRERGLALSAGLEAVLDFDDEDDVAVLPAQFAMGLLALSEEMEAALAAPSAEKLREGYRIAIAGPPNAGKSTLFNALLGSEAAIATPFAGTTRDVIERPVAIEGVPITLVDMAGLHDATSDPVEAIGIERAREELLRADLVLWLGPEGEGPPGCWEVAGQCDRADAPAKANARFEISAVTGEGIEQLIEAMVEQARSGLPAPGEAVLNQRQRILVRRASTALGEATSVSDHLIVAEHLRVARAAFDALLGRTATEDVLDAIFGRFCIGK